MTENTEATVDEQRRELPERIVIPPIRGEMVHLRPATVEDLPKLDELKAYYGATNITGKDETAERAVVHAWVRRSVAWTHGQAASESGVGDPEARRTMAWALLTDADHDADHVVDAASTDNVIGMIFLIDIDGWSRSARIQVILGKDYRGRGYSRDAMPGHDLRFRARTGRSRYAPHLGGGSGTELARRLRLSVTRIRAVRHVA